MRLDLHMHTDLSDGTSSPEEVVEGAVAGRLDVIAITDHDTAAGVRRAQAAAGDRVEVIAGIELSSTLQGREVHILAYGVDPESPALVAHQNAAETRRRARMGAMVSRLNDAGIEIGLDEVVEAAGPGVVMIGRPHLARVLVRHGHAESVPHAFDTLIGNEHAAYIPTSLGEPEEAIQVALEAGGIPIWAHPASDRLHEKLPDFVAAGLRGLEAYRPNWPRRRVRQVVAAAEREGLFVTGGSDWHGPGRNGRIGEFWVTPGLVRPFLEALGIEVD